ncbi:lycopene cyclase [Flavivirga aquatica]|uniref:Lycopene cyclase n=1 Tax=Flavivirga aquatica TaxID=1849968 RepID=A0A1E5SI91_9FLAO|nr:lycopene cyclase family protein [Flavivirga aquatica]OEJ98825.1 lycopene cyclase [Flavivirga aquatica]
MTNNFHFDYIIIGNGLAGLQLALKMVSDSFFKDKNIALIDPLEKNTNDKTWSFWEKEPSKWNHISYKSWKSATVHTSKKTIHLQLAPYTYKTIRSIDFYTNAKTELLKYNNISFIKDTVISIPEADGVTVETTKNIYTALHVFDSRLPEKFLKKTTNHITLIQHFKGYIIKTETESFNENNFTMMDYRLKDGEQTTFTYVLPFSKNEALIEFTYFTEDLVNDKVYDDYIKRYIKDYLKINKYSILEIEKGQIPMTNFPFDTFNTKHITKIGAGGGWVKASTGYSFKHTEKKVTKIIDNLKVNKIPSSNLFNNKYKFYDTVFLKVLKDENHKGEWIFQQFYDKNTIQTMFKFLDEDSNFFEELKIMRSLFSWSFIKAFFKTL